MNISLCLNGASEPFLVLRWVGWEVPYTFHINLRFFCNGILVLKLGRKRVEYAAVGGGGGRAVKAGGSSPLTQVSWNWWLKRGQSITHFF